VIVVDRYATAIENPARVYGDSFPSTDRRAVMGYNRSGTRRTARLKRAKREAARLAKKETAGGTAKPKTSKT
jgi:hypothetical protein